MTTKDLLQELESLGTAQNRKIYTRHGVTDPMFGVSYGNQDKLAKRIRKEGQAGLAVELWESGNHDAKVLATKILDPATLTQTTANSLVRGVTHSLQGSGLAAVFAETAFAAKLADKWIAADPKRSHWKVYTGWALIASIAIAKKHHLDIPDTWFSTHLATIENSIHQAPNDIRDQMNSTLIAIGSRNEALRDKAIAKAKKIGPVEVDHGDTSCKTPDAVSYIKKVWDRRK